jgi:hypothetical protein
MNQPLKLRSVNDVDIRVLTVDIRVLTVDIRVLTVDIRVLTVNRVADCNCGAA